MKYFQKKYIIWSTIVFIIGGIIFIPLLFVLKGFEDGTNDNIEHIKEYELWNYIFTTIRMIIGVAIFSILLAVPTAYCVSHFKFPLRKFLVKANVLPITVPTYIMGFVYASIFSVTGTFTKIALLFFTEEQIFSWNINVVKEGWLMCFLAFALYPYVYSSTLLYFKTQNKKLNEAAQTLGVSPLKRLLKITLPLSIPSILAGVGLVVMEVVNDYGAMSYFNVKTITAGIFQAKQMDFAGSLYLSAILFIAVTTVFGSLFVIRNLRKVSNEIDTSNNALIQLSKPKGALVSLLVFFPFFLGFVIPLLQLIYLTLSKLDAIDTSGLLRIGVNSFQLALIPALIIVLLAIIFQYTLYLNPSRKIKMTVGFSTIGYAIPGAVIGVSVMGFVLLLDQNNGFYTWSINSLFLMMFAYVVRFFAVGYNTMEGNFNQISKNIPDASRSLGFGSFSTFIKVYFPLLKFGIVTTLSIVIVDVLKELPLTLILQPYNFETLATKTYKKASVAESVADASPYALILIGIGVLSTLFLMTSKRKK